MTKRFKYLGLFLLWVPIIFIGVVTVQAATYYVATTGDDVDSGSESLPFKTIKKGLKLLQAGDTLYIRGGTYPEAISSNAQTIPTGTSWENAPVISAHPGEAVVLRPPGGTEVINLAHPYIQYVIFQGLDLDASGLQRSCPDGYGCSYGVSGTNGAHHVRFRNIEIKNAAGSGVLITHGASNAATAFEFIDCDVHHNGTSFWDHGLYISTSGNQVRNSKVHHNASFGIHLYTGDLAVTANNNTLDGNDVSNNAVVSESSPGILVTNGSGNRVSNNIVRGNKNGIHVGSAFSSEVNTSGTTIYNNTIYGNTPGVGIDIFPSSSHTDVQNNNVATVRNQGRNTVNTNNRSEDVGTEELSRPHTPTGLGFQ
ncbi:MAG TPA: right-handed parallel beta-helix repeat-containing protein [Nitrospiraceae bacterium]|nr:right-handed parallel beta-helix repeat-containing protein [Nitrospiraceae bacterium]